MTAGRDPLPTRVEGLPALADAAGALLDEGLASLGLDLAPPSRAALRDHLRLLAAWNAAINLTAIRDPVDAVREHLLDSLAAAGLLAGARAADLVDLGSGGGFPGLPLVVALPGTRWLLVDSIAKKARFLEAAVSALGLEGRVAVAAVRAEALARSPGHRERHDAVVARAVARLAVLTESALPLIRTGGLLVAWKRAPLDDELAEARETVRLVGGDPPRVHRVTVAGLEDHVLVTIRKERPTPRAFPRDAARRTRRPR